LTAVLGESELLAARLIGIAKNDTATSNESKTASQALFLP
jgi:hypothetical protein